MHIKIQYGCLKGTLGCNLGLGFCCNVHKPGFKLYQAILLNFSATQNTGARRQIRFGQIRELECKVVLRRVKHPYMHLKNSSENLKKEMVFVHMKQSIHHPNVDCVHGTSWKRNNPVCKKTAIYKYPLFPLCGNVVNVLSRLVGSCQKGKPFTVLWCCELKRFDQWVMGICTIQTISNCLRGSLRVQLFKPNHEHLKETTYCLIP